MNLVNVIAWVSANWGNILGLVVTVIAAASLLIKAMEGLVKVLVTLFPKLQGADGKLLKLAAWLDALANSSWLHTLAANPKKVDP